MISKASRDREMPRKISFEFGIDLCGFEVGCSGCYVGPVKPDNSLEACPYSNAIGLKYSGTITLVLGDADFTSSMNDWSLRTAGSCEKV